jgi:hypothetical protein
LAYGYYYLGFSHVKVSSVIFKAADTAYPFWDYEWCCADFVTCVTAFQYFENDVGIVEGFHFQAIGWSARLTAILYALGLLWAVFVVIYSVRKLGLRLMGIGQSGRTKSVVFLMAVAIMYYAPNLLPLILLRFYFCEQTAFVGALYLVESMVPVSIALCTFLVWREFIIFKRRKDMESISTTNVSLRVYSTSQSKGLSFSQLS